MKMSMSNDTIGLSQIFDEYEFVLFPIVLLNFN